GRPSGLPAGSVGSIRSRRWPPNARTFSVHTTVPVTLAKYIRTPFPSSGDGASAPPRSGTGAPWPAPPRDRPRPPPGRCSRRRRGTALPGRRGRSRDSGRGGSPQPPWRRGRPPRWRRGSYDPEVVDQGATPDAREAPRGGHALAGGARDREAGGAFPAPSQAGVVRAVLHEDRAVAGPCHPGELVDVARVHRGGVA